MHPRILTRCTTFVVFVFTCCLTLHVVANERELAPLLSPEGWKLLADVEAYKKGYIPTRVTRIELEPRQGVIQTELVKRPNSRVKVKFADNMQIRLDVHNKPYSRTQRSSQTITDICESLGVTLVPTISQSHEDVDALIRKAENMSRKQQPDIGGIYWINGDDTSVDVAAEMFFTMEEVEWVLYKPVYSKMQRQPIQPDFTPAPAPAQAKASSKLTVANEFAIGACVMLNRDCFETSSGDECANKGGTFLGAGSICYERILDDSVDLEKDQNFNRGDAGTGECCILGNCVPTLAEGQCNALNGIFLGFDTNAPPTPCGAASQTDCPPGVGPLFTEFNLCGEDGTPNSYFTGDCYIDQTVNVQTNRVVAAQIPGTFPGFPIGCLDTNGLTGLGFTGPIPSSGAPGLATDFIVVTGLPTGAGTNIALGSTCCETISTDVPDCGTGAWNLICASYAHGYAFNASANGGAVSCTRTPASITPVNVCFNALGPIQDVATVQPRINMSAIYAAGDGLLLSNSGAGGDANCTVQILDPTANGCADFDCTLDITGNITGLVSIPLTGDPTVPGFSDVNAIAALVNAAGNGWAAVVEGPGTAADSLFAPTAQVIVFNTGFAVSSVPQSVTTTPFAAASCFGVNGAPTFPRAAATPDYAALGLLTNMTTQLIPWLGSPTQPPQLLAFPSSTTNLTNDQIFHISQLLPWPMGGANIQGGTATLPLSATAGNLGWYGGDAGMDLFPTAPNPGGFGGAEVYLGSYGYGQFWADDGVGTNGAFGNGVKVAVLDWSAHLQGRAIVDEFGTTVNLGGIHEEFLANGLATTTVDANGNVIAMASTVTLEGTATGHSPVTLLFDENMAFGYSADHGTAVLGTIGANWSTASPLPGAATYPPTLATRFTGPAGVTPNIGTIGLAPDADLYFFPLATNTVADRQDQAWFNAMETMDAGDVICAAYRPVAITAALPNLCYWPDTATYMQLANNLGLCTVVRAGDQGVDLAALTRPDGDQNTMVATAVSPGAPLKRLANATRSSNFSTTANDATNTTASAFGMGVVACGKGPQRNNFLGYSTIAYTGVTPYLGPNGSFAPAADPWIVNAQSYTNNFSGTGAAAAQLAGCAAQVQGFTKQIYGVAMGPQILRQLMAGGKYEGRNRDGTPNLQPPPDTYGFFTEQGVDSSEDSMGNATWDFVASTPGNLTGPMLNPRGAMVNAIINPIFETPSISQIFFIRGSYLFGNIFSLAAIDGNLAAATPVLTQAHVPYSVPAGVPGGRVRYFSHGFVTDLYVTGQLESNLPMNNSLTVDVTLFSVQQAWMFLQLEMYNQRSGRWDQVSTITQLMQGDTGATFVVTGGSDYINPATNTYHARIISTDINTPNNGPNAVYPVMYDQIRISAGAIQH